MSYTIVSARYANSENTSAVIETAEAGAIAISLADTPELWSQMLATASPAPALGYLADLAQAQAHMWDLIKDYRDKRSDTSGYLVSGKWFHSDQKSKTQQIALVLAGASLPPFQWKTLDGSFVTMTPALAVSIFQTAMQRDSEIFGIAEQHKANMMVSTDPLNYDFMTGWPQGYGE